MIESKKKRRLMTLSTNVLLSTLFSVIVLVVVVTVIAALPISIFLLPPPPFSYAQQQQRNAAINSAACISYDSKDNIITITCGSARLTDIDNQIKDAKVIHKEGQGKTAEPANGSDHRGIWLLNAGIVVANQATLYINSTDT